MKQLIVAFILAFSVVVPAAADEFEEKATKLLELSNAVQPTLDMMDNMLVSMAPNMVQQMHTSYLNSGKYIAESEIEQLVSEWRQIYVSRMGEKLVPMIVAQYRKFLTIEDLDYLIEVMQQPSFQRFSNMVPEMMASSQKMGEEVGQKVGQEVMQELIAKYPQFQ